MSQVRISSWTQWLMLMLMLNCQTQKDGSVETSELSVKIATVNKPMSIQAQTEHRSPPYKAYPSLVNGFIVPLTSFIILKKIKRVLVLVTTPHPHPHPHLPIHHRNQVVAWIMNHLMNSNFTTKQTSQSNLMHNVSLSRKRKGSTLVSLKIASLTEYPVSWWPERVRHILFLYSNGVF